MCKQEGNATFRGKSELQEPTLPDYAVFIVRCIVFAAAHSLFASDRAKRFISRVAGKEPRCYRLFYNLTSMAVFAWVMMAYRTAPLLYAVPGIWRWLMYSAQTVIVIAILLCVRQTGAGDFLGFRQLHSAAAQPRRLVTSGAYARVRHPLYLYSTLFLVLNPVMTAQWAVLTIFSLTYFIVGGMIEERRFMKEFGSEYREYRRQVPFMIPAIRPGKRP